MLCYFLLLYVSKLFHLLVPTLTPLTCNRVATYVHASRLNLSTGVWQLVPMQTPANSTQLNSFQLHSPTHPPMYSPTHQPIQPIQPIQSPTFSQLEQASPIHLVDLAGREHRLAPGGRMRCSLGLFCLFAFQQQQTKKQKEMRLV